MLPAMLRAARACYLVTLLLLGFCLLFPGLGLAERLERVWGEGRVVSVALGLVILGLLAEHLLGGLTRHRQSALARALLRLQPTLKHKGAIEILIRALESPDESVSEAAHRELKRITQQDLPAEPERWRVWLREEERATMRGSRSESTR